MHMPRALEPLRHRDFRLLLTGQTVSVVGNFVHNVALPFQILALGGGALAFGVDAATFFFSFAVLAFARPPRREPPAPAPLLRQVREGLAYTFSVPWLWIFIFAWALVLLGQVGPLNVGLPIYVRDVLGGDARLFGLLTASLGAGQVVTGIALAQLDVRRLGIGICVFAIAGGLAVAGLGLVPGVPFAVLFLAIFGAQFVGVGVLWTTAVQKHVPPAVMGRVMSIDYFGGTLLLPVAPVVFAAVITAVG